MRILRRGASDRALAAHAAATRTPSMTERRPGRSPFPCRALAGLPSGPRARTPPTVGRFGGRYLYVRSIRWCSSLASLIHPSALASLALTGKRRTADDAHSSGISLSR